MSKLLSALKSRKSTDQCKDTGLALVLLLLLALLASKREILLFPAMGILILTMTGPRLLQPLAVAWFGLAQLLSEVMGRVILTLIFLLIVTPIGLLRRLAGRDAMGLRGWKSSAASVFTIRDHHYGPADLEKPY